MNRFKSWRANLILILFIIFGAAIVSRLFYLQILEHKLFAAQALGQQVGFSSVAGYRGQIFCHSGESGGIKSLATNQNSWTISVNLKEIDDKQAFAKILSSALDQTEDQIIAKLNNQDSYITLAKGLSDDELDKVKEKDLAGLSWQNNPVRFYPQNDFVSQVVGFLGGEGSGQYGIEGYYEDSLKGKSGIMERKSGIDFLFSSASPTSLDGSDVYLTIDYYIQLQAEALLNKYKSKLDMDAGQIIVMKPDTGKIVALANFPGFNPNKYSKEKDLDIFQNSAMQKLFEPGSILKPFTMAAALNEGKITPDTTYTDTGTVQFGTKVIHNFAKEKYGLQTMTQVLEKSINTGAVYAEEKLDHQTFLDYFDKFGFFKKTGVDLQGEVFSRNDNLKSGPDMNYATASFGQGIELTPIQVARGFCAFANGGKLVKPYIVEKIGGPAGSGREEIQTKPEISQPIISQQTASQITTMLISVVDNGFNSVAKIPGYYLAGKTGTAQVPLSGGKGYDPDKTIQSFIGYGPALNPQFLILVKLDDPKVSKSSLSAVPVFKELAQYIINYWKIPPDYDIAQ
jgi:cell division protein FtsI (penicillin-binding protein 3)/stage V sporulation protein D (sporulation-specific penicillin-binding protein)